jgi:uncharacterized protein (DUF934 family)
MPLVKSHAVVADGFVRVSDEEPVPGGSVLLTAARFLADPQGLFQSEGLLQRNGKVGVIWPNNKDVADLKPYLDRLAAVALVFPTFRDGRAYSQARLLRERYGFDGELRATGQVLRDQFIFLLRAGFDAFEVKKEADAAVFAKVAERYSVFYQPTGDGRKTATSQRITHHEGARS